MLNQVRRLLPVRLRRAARAKFDAWADTGPLSERVQTLTDLAESAQAEQRAGHDDLAGRLEELRQSAHAVQRAGHDELARRLEEFRQSAQAERRAGHDELAGRLDELAETINYLKAWTFELQPDTLQPSPEACRLLADRFSAHGVDAGRLNTAVSKNDAMFEFIVRTFLRGGRSIDQAFIQYLFSGLHMRQVLATIVGRKFGSLSAVPSLLDFASGYGRLTRHLVSEVDPARVWVSDIKARAVAFQRHQFGVNGFVSAAAPEDLTVDGRFDCVFVGSLFSHLPEATFGRWLQRLCDLLTPSGLLVFTVHDASVLSGWSGAAHTYHAVSEETGTRTADGPLDAAAYGTAYVTEAFVRRAVERLEFPNRRYARYPRGLWKLQDVYVLSRDPADDLSGLTLPRAIS